MNPTATPLRLIPFALGLLTLSACASFGELTASPEAIETADWIEAAPSPTPPPTVTYVAVPEPLPLPGQLRPLTAAPARTPEPTDPGVRVIAANSAARVEPTRDGYLNAIQVYPWAPGALYQVYTSPGQVTDIGLQPGERLVGSGPVAAGDTVRWIIGDTQSGVGPDARVHILIKPTRPDINTNMVIHTDRRTYYLELRATPWSYMASVSWTYPQDDLIALRRTADMAALTSPVAGGIDTARLNFAYRLSGDRPRWRPVRVFDDGQQVFIEFPQGVSTTELPPLFVLGPSGAELVNYRLRGAYMVVDTLFDRAELRLGSGGRAQTVRISRTGGQP